MGWVVFLHDGTPSRVHSGLSLAAAAAATGKSVLLVFEAGALVRLVGGRLDDELPDTLPAPTELLDGLKSLGGEVVACPTRIVAAGLTEEAVAPYVDRVMGLAEIVERCEGATVVVF